MIEVDFASYLYYFNRIPQFDSKVIVYLKVGTSPISLAFAILSVGKTRHARMNIHLYIVRSTGYYPIFPFWGNTVVGLTVGAIFPFFVERCVYQRYTAAP